VFGAFILVLALFFVGVWLLRNWQRLALQRGAAPKLHILEVKSLGNRHTLYVVGYEQQRMLIGASVSGLSLISPLPPSDSAEPPAPNPGVTFMDALQKALNRK
jgi:flagellar biogenesis protein FliO